MVFKKKPKPKPDPNAPKLPFHKRFFREWIMPLVIVAAILLPIRSSVADWNDVPTGSMRPTIIEGDRIFVNKLAYGLRIPFTTRWLTRWDDPHRGDIVTFKSPTDGIQLVKRIIGIPGDKISLDRNVLTVNGVVAAQVKTGDDMIRVGGVRSSPFVNVKLLDEALPASHGSSPTIDHAITLTLQRNTSLPDTVAEFTVPPGMYYVMGDNRDMSADSRAFNPPENPRKPGEARIVFVPAEWIYGRSTHIALSVNPDNYYMPRFGRFFDRMK